MFKSKKELVIALIDGRRFKTMSGRILFYDETITADPFRCKDGVDLFSKAMADAWSHYDTVTELKEWYNNIPKDGVLCWVWNDNEYEKSIRLVMCAKVRNTVLFRTNPSVYWNSARPLTKEELLERMVMDK